MKVHFKANKGYIYEANIPEFKDGKYLMGIARQAKDLLFKSYVELDYPSIKAAYDLLKGARKHFSPIGHTEFNQNTDTDLIEKGYEEYCKVLDRIMAKLITAMWVTINLQEEPEEEEMWAFHMKSKGTDAVANALYGDNGLIALSNGKIKFGAGCREYDYVYTTSTIWEEDDKKYYLPDFGGLNGLKETLKQVEA